MINILNPNVIIEVVCLFIASIFLYNDKSLHWKSIIIFMLITCVTEILGIIFRKEPHCNNLIYNIYLVIEVIFTSILFNYLLNIYIASKTFVIPGLVLLAFVYSYEIYKHGIFEFNVLTTTIMSILFIFYSFYYYYLLIKDEQHINLKFYAPFWWVSGTVFFYFGSIVNDLYFTVVDSQHSQIFVFRHLIFIVLNITLYTFWSYSFICIYLQRKSIL